MGRTKIKLEFAVFGGLLDPKQFDDLIKLNSTEYWYKGDLIPEMNSRLTRKETAWCYTTGFLETLDIEEITSKFFEDFNDRVDFISDYLNKYKAEAKVYFVIETWNEESPAVYFDNKFLHLINEIKAEIDIDLYYIKD